MIWTLRHISLLFLITVSVSIPFSFLILPWLIGFFPGINPFITGFTVAGFCFFLIGWGMDRAVKKVMAGLVKEGQAWERAGIVSKALKKYVRAVRLFDSFGLWPLGAGRRTADELTGIISRFQLNTRVDNPNFKTAVLVYLKRNPSDKETCLLWLRQVRQAPVITSGEQELLSLLAETHADDKELSVRVADIFLGLERSDFTASKLYAHVRKEPGLGDRYVKKIEEIIGEQEPLPGSEYRAPLSAERPGSQPAESRAKKTAVSVITAAGIAAGGMYRFFSAAGQTVQKIFRAAGLTARSVIWSAVRAVDYLKEHEQARFYFRAGVLVLVSGWLIFFVSGTVSHLVKSKPVEKQEETIATQGPKPFTIQVAAYLKQSHADRYVALLRKKEIDARVKKVAGGGKTWFVVRVSEFEDKKSAAEFGENLKKQKIIDDYFVNNN